jgi:steroid 5-alpha reductase family enzyme
MAWMALSRTRSFAIVVLAYLAALAVVGGVAAVVDGEPWLRLLAADLAATAVVFAFSVACNNSSVYDAYWSVAPMVIVLALGTTSARGYLVTALVLAWGARLTWNWARGWRGLGHEDWRYVEIRAKTGRAYWPVSFVGVHVMPTLWVYLGALALIPALASPAPLGLLDLVGLVVTVGAIALEAIADEQLRRFRRDDASAGTILARGVWRWSRHPNYLGEILFWWGLFAFALAAEPGGWWRVVGPLGITILFVAISIPLLDRRSVARRPGYREHMTRVPALVPRPWR